MVMAIMSPRDAVGVSSRRATTRNTALDSRGDSSVDVPNVGLYFTALDIARYVEYLLDIILISLCLIQ